MAIENRQKLGDFTGLALDYSANRPGYSSEAINQIKREFKENVRDLKALDVGAGTGIWTRMLAQAGFGLVKAVEPNEDMLKRGMLDSRDTNIEWIKSPGESIPLEDNSFNLLSMASSFHWCDFDKATLEFKRLLKPNGIFIALWNPRYIEHSQLLIDIENQIKVITPNLKRVSSGVSSFTENLSEKLHGTGHFDSVSFYEFRHSIEMTRQRYIGAWESVNDLRSQMGPNNFETFLTYIKKKTEKIDIIDAQYNTRLWIART